MRLKIRDLREDHDFTQQQVAEYVGCDRSLYSKYEREEREIPLHALLKLAELYKTSLDYLVGLTEQARPYPRRK